LTVGYPVINLKRVGFGNLSLGTLKEGKCRALTATEIKGLKKLVGL
jgi:16S rRNA U516 pseudouridylate synthase RsuA-like enzyme